MVERTRGPIRVLFLCTGNSARSQMAEAWLGIFRRVRDEIKRRVQLFGALQAHNQEGVHA